MTGRAASRHRSTQAIEPKYTTHSSRTFYVLSKCRPAGRQPSHDGIRRRTRLNGVATLQSHAMPMITQHDQPGREARASFATGDNLKQLALQASRHVAGGISPVVEHRLQYRQRRGQRVAIAKPAVQALAVHRLNHLGVARRGDIALLARVLVEPQHG